MSLPEYEFVAVLPDGTEVIITSHENEPLLFEWQSMGTRVLLKLAKFAKYGQPENVMINFYLLSVKDGRINREFKSGILAECPMHRFTEKEFKEQTKTCLEMLPPEFRSYVMLHAVNQGFNQMNNWNAIRILAVDVNNLKVVLEQYSKRLFRN